MVHDTSPPADRPGHVLWSWFLLPVVILGVHLQAANAQAQTLDQLRAKADSQFHQDLELLARQCDDLALGEQARLTRQLIAPVRKDQNRIYVPWLSKNLEPSGGAPEQATFWHTHLLKHCKEQATRLYPVAEKLKEQGAATEAYQLLHEILYLDPDHEQVKKILGPDSATSRPRSVRARTNHPLLSWQARNYWTVSSRHFTIVTNHSARAGLDLARQLERLHLAWRQMFFPYWSKAELLSKRWTDPNTRLGLGPRKHQVVLFADRTEYEHSLIANQARINLTTGFYNYDTGVANFFMAKPAPTATWDHEVTHQLMQEMRQVPKQVGLNKNFWIVEGVALYMESIREHDCYLTIGGFDSNRLQFARYRHRAGGFSLPLEQLVMMGRAHLQMADNIGELYSHSAGLAQMLMDGRGNRDRAGLLKYIDQVYLAEDDTNSLSETIGRAMDKLDKEYDDFLVVSDQDLAQLSSEVLLNNLCLYDCPISDKGLQHLAGQTQLRWLDLTRTPVTDKGFAVFADSTRLEQLFLGVTQISDQSLKLLGGMQQLEELDLSHTKVTDDGLAALSGLRQLKALYLTGTPVSDKGLRHLESLKQLKELDLDGTEVSEAAVKQLRAKLPNLK